MVLSWIQRVRMNGKPRQHLKALPYHEVSAALEAVDQ